MKKPVAKIDERKTPAAPDPTWTEDELRQVADFVNYAYHNIRVTTTLQEAKTLKGEAGKAQKMFNDMHAHVSKLERYVLDFKPNMQPKQAGKK